MNYYVVLSKEYYIIDPVLDFGQGPKEYRRDYALVKAPNTKEAKVNGLKILRKLKTSYKWDETGENPFKDMKIIKITKSQYNKNLH